MSDLTIGDTPTFQVQLLAVDQSKNPPSSTPLDLTNATQVQLSWLITSPESPLQQQPTKTAPMGIVGNPTSGTVFYDFLPGDLVKPANMGKNGVFRYFVRVTFNNGMVLTTSSDGQLTIKDDSIL